MAVSPHPLAHQALKAASMPHHIPHQGPGLLQRPPQACHAGITFACCCTGHARTLLPSNVNMLHVGLILSGSRALLLGLAALPDLHNRCWMGHQIEQSLLPHPGLPASWAGHAIGQKPIRDTEAQQQFADLKSLLVEAAAQAQEDALPQGVRPACRVKVQGRSCRLAYAEVRAHLAAPRGRATQCSLHSTWQSIGVGVPQQIHQVCNACD